MGRVLLIAVMCVLLWPWAAAAQQWLGNRVEIPGGGYPLGLAVADSGETLALVERYGSQLTFVARPPGGSFGDPQVVGTAPDGEIAFVARPDGAAIAVWHHHEDRNDAVTELRYATRPPGGAFSAPAAVPGSAGADFRPVVAYDAAGSAVIAWITRDPGSRVMTTSLRSDGGVTSTQSLGPAENQADGALAITANRAGDVLLAWPSFPAQGQGRLHASLRLRGAGEFPAATTIGPDTWAGPFSISAALAPDGTAAIAWLQHVSDGLDEPHAFVALRSAGAARFGERVVVARSVHGGGPGRGATLQRVRAAFGASGALHLLYVTTKGDNSFSAHGMSARAGSTTFSPPVLLAETTPPPPLVPSDPIAHPSLLSTGTGAVSGFPAAGHRVGYVDDAGWRPPISLSNGQEYAYAGRQMYVAVNGTGRGAAMFLVRPSGTEEGEQTLIVSDFSGVAAPADRVAPRVRRARFARRAFRFSLSEPAVVRITITRVGRRRSSGTLARTLKAGSRRVAFSGRIGRTALRRGRYRARLVATDAAGNRSRAVTVRFRLAR